MDTEAEALQEKQRFKRLSQEIEQMLQDTTLDYRQITKTLDYNCYSTPDKLAVVRVLCDVRKTGLHDKKKLQKVINHYAIEHENVLALKP